MKDYIKAIFIGLVLISLSYPVVFLFGVSRISMTILFYIIPIASFAGYAFTSNGVQRGRAVVRTKSGRAIECDVVGVSSDFLIVDDGKKKMIKMDEVTSIEYLNTSTGSTERSEPQYS